MDIRWTTLSWLIVWVNCSLKPAPVKSGPSWQVMHLPLPEKIAIPLTWDGISAE